MLKDTSLDAVCKDKTFDMWPMPKIAAKGKKYPAEVDQIE